MQATVTPKEANDKSVTWSSSNTDIASVDENGLVTVHKKMEKLRLQQLLMQILK